MYIEIVGTQRSAYCVSPAHVNHHCESCDRYASETVTVLSQVNRGFTIDLARLR
jgi:hypothetical protein